MEPILPVELTKLKKERLKECQNEFGCSGHLYYIPECCLGAGWEIVWSANKLASWTGFEPKTMRCITDTEEMLNKI